jgi:copper(I)-binding protein
MNTLTSTMTRALLLTAIIGLYACDSSTDKADVNEPITALSAADHITVSNAWIRPPAPGQTVTGAFMTLTNSSETASALTSASSSIAAVVEIHETSMSDGMMRMRKVSHVDIPANGFAELKPGSFHIMLIDLEKELEPGSTEVLTLTFSDDSQIDVVATIGKLSE